MNSAIPPEALHDERAQWTAIQQAREAGIPVHQLGAPAARLLTEHDIYTTEVPRNPGAFRVFQRERRKEEVHEQIAACAEETFRNVPEFKDAVAEGRLGHELIGVFAAVTSLEADNVHIPTSDIDKDGLDYGTVVAERMRWTTGEDPAAARKLGIALGGLLHSRRFHSISTEGPTVEFRELNEHQARSLARVIGALAAREYQRYETAVTLPPGEKRSLHYWDENGETFNPEMRQRFLAADAAYEALEKKATYAHSDQLQPVNRADYHLIINDKAAALQGVRDIFNGMIHAVRGGSSRHNKEQNPDIAARPFIEEGVELRRDKVLAEENWEGPPSSRTPSTLERTQAGSAAVLAEAKRHPTKALLRGAGNVVSLAGGGIIEASLKTAEVLPGATDVSKQLNEDRKEWKIRKKRFKDAHEEIDRLVRNRLWHLTFSR